MFLKNGSSYLMTPVHELSDFGSNLLYSPSWISSCLLCEVFSWQRSPVCLSFMCSGLRSPIKFSVSVFAGGRTWPRCFLFLFLLGDETSLDVVIHFFLEDSTGLKCLSIFFRGRDVIQKKKKNRIFQKNVFPKK